MLPLSKRPSTPKKSVPNNDLFLVVVLLQSPAKARRANVVKKSILYFSDKKNRSMSEDNLYTRRKNLAVHLGLDEKVPRREIQKITTICLPIPAEAAPTVLSKTQASLVKTDADPLSSVSSH